MEDTSAAVRIFDQDHGERIITQEELDSIETSELIRFEQLVKQYAEEHPGFQYRVEWDIQSRGWLVAWRTRPVRAVELYTEGNTK